MYKLTLLLALATCGPTPVPPPHVPPDPADPVARQSNCTAAQRKLEELNCREKATPAGKPYGQFCMEQISKGNTMNAACVALIQNCASIDTCTGSR